MGCRSQKRQTSEKEENEKGDEMNYEITSLDESAIEHGAITESEEDINESLDIYGDYDEDKEEVV